jgi:hypothetical protein
MPTGDPSIFCDHKTKVIIGDVESVQISTELKPNPGDLLYKDGKLVGALMSPPKDIALELKDIRIFPAHVGEDGVSRKDKHWTFSFTPDFAESWPSFSPPNRFYRFLQRVFCGIYWKQDG